MLSFGTSVRDQHSVGRLTRCFYMETIESTTCICNGVYPLRGKGGVNVLWIGGGSEKTLYLFGFGNHHVTIHKNSWNPLSYAFQHRCTYAESLGNISTSRSGGLSRHTHRDIRHEMTEKFMVLVIEGSQCMVSDGTHPSITSATV